MATTAGTRPRQGGPPLILLGGIFAAFTLAYVAPGAIGASQPSASAAEALARAQAHVTALQIGGFLQFAASFPLAIFTATAYTRLRRLGVTAPGPAIGLVGGLLASTSLALCGLVGWTTSQAAPDLDAPLAKTLSLLSFALGGPGYAVPFALLVAGLAVPSLFLGFVPKPVAWAGLVIAGLAVLGTFFLLTDVAGPTLPIGRFGGLIWLLAFAIMVPSNRARRAAPEAS
jgi:hypothetical protein